VRQGKSCALGRTERHARVLRLAALIAAGEVGVACAQTCESQTARVWSLLRSGHSKACICNATQRSQLSLHLRLTPCIGRRQQNCTAPRAPWKPPVLWPYSRPCTSELFVVSHAVYDSCGGHAPLTNHTDTH